MNLVEMLEGVRHLLQYGLGGTAVHLVDIIAFERVHKALGHAIRLRAAHRRMHGLDAQLLCQCMRVLGTKRTTIIAEKFQFDIRTGLCLPKAESQGLYIMKESVRSSFAN